MDIYPATSDVTVPSGVRSKSTLGWWVPPETAAPQRIDLDLLRRRAQNTHLTMDLLLPDDPLNREDMTIWRELLRPSLHGLT